MVPIDEYIFRLLKTDKELRISEYCERDIVPLELKPRQRSNDT